MITRILCTDLAGLRAQALGLAEAAGLTPELQNLKFRSPWDKIAPGLWPSARWAVDGAAFAEPLPPVVMGAGGAGARVAASLRRPGVKAVAIQHPRMALDKFDLVMAARHDGISGDNVVVTRTALHRVPPARSAGDENPAGNPLTPRGLDLGRHRRQSLFRHARLCRRHHRDGRFGL